MLRAENRLKKRKEFGYIYKNGKIMSAKDFNIYYVPSNRRKFKMGFSVSKKIGKAVVRNRVKRVLRSVVMNNINIVPNNYNYIINTKPSITECTYMQLESEFINTLTKNKMINL